MLDLLEEILWPVLVCFLAGAGAGLGTGFAGMSAATVISPMLTTFLGLPAYEAIGIALASDVLASAVSARAYARTGALDIRGGLVMMAGVLVMTLVGSALSALVPGAALGGCRWSWRWCWDCAFSSSPICLSGRRTGAPRCPAGYCAALPAAARWG